MKGLVFRSCFCILLHCIHRISHDDFFIHMKIAELSQGSPHVQASPPQFVNNLIQLKNTRASDLSGQKFTGPAPLHVYHWPRACVPVLIQHV